MNARASRDEGAETPIADQCLENLPRRRIHVERDLCGDCLAADNLRRNGEVAPSRIGGGANIGLVDFLTLHILDRNYVAGARRFGDERFKLR
jgi:hypothetical protein